MEEDRTQFPPGTLRLERLLDHTHGEVILHPIPSTDPNDPLNWPRWYKILNFGLVCYYTLMVFVLLDIGTVIWADLNTDLGIPYEWANISFGINTAGLAVGCVFFIPFALKYGRRVVYLASIVVSLATAIWQAKMMTTADLIGSNLISGLAGATSETICQMTIADVFFVHERGTTNAIYLLMVNIGAFLAPVAAGYSAVSQGWRWIWWWTTILLTVCLVLYLFLYEDTKYSPAAAEARRQSSIGAGVAHTTDADDASQQGDHQIKELVATSVRQVDPSIPRKTYFQRMALLNTSPGWSSFARHIYQPFVILFTFPAITYTALMYGSLLAWFSVVVNVYSIYFAEPPYNFDAAGIGLMNLPPFIGGAIGTIYGMLTVDRSIVWLSRRNNGVFEPEMRLWAALPAVIIMPAGLLWFGLSTANAMHWAIPAVGCGFFGFGFVVLGDVALTYAMDCYKDIIGDALIGIVFVRNVFATIIATTLTPWINGVGLSNVAIMSTVLALALSLLTIPMMIYGKRCRIWTADRLEAMAAKQYVSRRD